MPRRPLRRQARALLALAALPAAAALGGCAAAARALARPYALAPTGLELGEQRLRDALAQARWDAALRQAGREKDGGPSDALLRELYRGTAAYYGGRWDESALALQRAAAMADDRYTKRVSRGALALATNDRALPYVPGDNERLFAHYYAALGYLHAGDLNGAAVEARRLAWRLQQAEARRDPLDASARAALRYVTGAVFEAAGDREDAEVAYRNAVALGAEADSAVARRAAADSALQGAGPAGAGAPRPGRRGGPAAPPVAAAPGPGQGDVVVVLEGGFVAHRVNERLSVRLDDGAAERLTLSSGGVIVAGAGRGAAAAWTPEPGSLGGRLAALLTGEQGLWAGDPPPALALADSGAGRPPAGDTVGVPARGVGDVLGRQDGTWRAGPWESRGATRRAPAPRPDGSAPWERARTQQAGSGGAAATVAEPPPRAGHGAGRGPGPGRTFVVAWPAYRRPAGWARGVGVVVDAPAAVAAAAVAAPAAVTTGTTGTTAAAGSAARAVVRGDLSLAAAGDFRRDRGKVLARLVTRAALRAALAGEAERRGRGLGDVVRLLGNATEQADTRSWHLLPAEVQVVRLRLPAGAHPLAVDVAGQRVPLGTVRVAPGAVRFVSARVWDAAGQRVTAFGTEGRPADGGRAGPPGLAAGI